jgi:hypothetical protein
MQELLRVVFPNHSWLEWKFKFQPASFWKDPHNVRRMLEWVSSQLKTKTVFELVDLPRKDIQNLLGP